MTPFGVGGLQPGGTARKLLRFCRAWPGREPDVPERLCAHEVCACEPAPDWDFCSPLCALREHVSPADEHGAEPCRCGHDTCRPEHIQPDRIRRRTVPHR